MRMRTEGGTRILMERIIPEVFRKSTVLHILLMAMATYRPAG